MAEPVEDYAPLVLAHTDEARQLIADGTVKPGDKALDVPIDSMTDREILMETLIHARNTRDAVTALVDGVMASPIGALIAGGKVSGPLGMLFGQGA
jgi:hypothetical protein